MAIPREILAVLLLPATLVVAAETVKARSRPSTPVVPDSTRAALRNAAPPLPASTRVTNVSLSETDTLVLTSVRDAAGAPVTTTLFLENETDGAAVIECVRAVMRDSAGAASTVDVRFEQATCQAADGPAGVTVAPWSLTSLTLSWNVPAMPRPLVGHLVFHFRDVTSTLPYFKERPIRVTAPAVTKGSPYAERFVLWTLVVAVLVSAAATFTKPMVVPAAAAVTWDPKTSWASNVGAAGGLVTALLTVTLPDTTRYLAKPAYALLSVVFVAITALAPTINGFIMRMSSSDGIKALGVAAASAVTLWGALGQVALAWSLFGELVSARVLPRLAAQTFQGLMIALSVLLVVYSVRSIRALRTATIADGAADGEDEAAFAGPRAARVRRAPAHALL